jgi:hypothetical protein
MNTALSASEGLAAFPLHQIAHSSLALLRNVRGPKPDASEGGVRLAPGFAGNVGRLKGQTKGAPASPSRSTRSPAPAAHQLRFLVWKRKEVKNPFYGGT